VLCYLNFNEQALMNGKFLVGHFW